MSKKMQKKRTRQQRNSRKHTYTIRKKTDLSERHISEQERKKQSAEKDVPQTCKEAG